MAKPIDLGTDRQTELSVKESNSYLASHSTFWRYSYRQNINSSLTLTQLNYSSVVTFTVVFMDLGPNDALMVDNGLTLQGIASLQTGQAMNIIAYDTRLPINWQTTETQLQGFLLKYEGEQRFTNFPSTGINLQ